MPAVIAVVVAVLLLLAIGFYLTRRSGGPVYGEQPPGDPHPTADFIGGQPQDLEEHAEAQDELWEQERERYRRRQEPP